MILILTNTVKTYIAQSMKGSRYRRRDICFCHCNPDAFRDKIDTQHNITELMQTCESHIFHILILIADFAADPAFARQSIHVARFTRTRKRKFHNHVSCYAND